MMNYVYQTVDIYRYFSISQGQCLELFRTEIKWNWLHVVAQLVETLCYKLEGCGFQFDS